LKLHKNSRAEMFMSNNLKISWPRHHHRITV